MIKKNIDLFLGARIFLDNKNFSDTNPSLLRKLKKKVDIKNKRLQLTVSKVISNHIIWVYIIYHRQPKNKIDGDITVFICSPVEKIEERHFNQANYRFDFFDFIDSSIEFLRK